MASSVGGGGGGEKGKGGGGGEMEGRRMSLSRQHAKDISDYTRQLLVKDRELESLRVRLSKVSEPLVRLLTTYVRTYLSSGYMVYCIVMYKVSLYSCNGTIVQYPTSVCIRIYICTLYKGRCSVMSFSV